MPTELDRRRRIRVPVWRERDSAIAAKEGVEAAPTPFFCHPRARTRSGVEKGEKKKNFFLLRREEGKKRRTFRSASEK